MTRPDPSIAALAERIRDIPDFPKPGILFRDVTPLLGHGPSLRQTIALLGERLAGQAPDTVVGIESRGFIFGAALAAHLGVGFVPVRKPGKLPFQSVRETYALEYGQDALEMHVDAVEGRRCVVVDDLLATGGTAAAAARLVERLGGQLAGFGFVVELAFLKGRDRLGDRRVESLITY
jgi:adenine phosphoribosyltransferase